MNHTGERDFPDEMIMRPRFQREFAAYKFCQKYITDKLVLDLGSGEGYGAFYFSKHAKRVIGVDIDPDVVVEARNKYKNDNLEFQVMDVNNLSFDDNFFDVTTSMVIIEHIKNYKKHIEESARVTKSGGLFILGAINRLESLQDDAFHYKEFDHFELRNMLDPYFDSIEIYSIKGITERVINYRQDRQNHARKFIRFDPLNLRKLISRSIYTKVYHYFQIKMRINLSDKYEEGFNQISTEDFSITNNDLESAWNLLCIARKK